MALDNLFFLYKKNSILYILSHAVDHSKSQVFHFAHPVFIELALSYIVHMYV